MEVLGDRIKDCERLLAIDCLGDRITKDAMDPLYSVSYHRPYGTHTLSLDHRQSIEFAEKHMLLEPW